MNDSYGFRPMNVPVQVGIKGLSSLSSSMIPGGLYVLIAETSSARFPLLAGSLSGALQSALPCTVIVPANPDGFVQRIESFGQINVDLQIRSDRLKLFVMQAEFSKKMFQFGAEAFVQELEHFSIPENSYLLFDQADDALSLHDVSLAMDQLEVLGRWLAQRKVTALMVFSRVTQAHDGTLNALMDYFTGIMRLGGDREGLNLVFDYWKSSEGTVAARHYQLSVLSNGLYEAAARRSAVASDRVGAVDVVQKSFEDVPADGPPHFFYMDPDLTSLAQQQPGVWQQVDTAVGLLHASRNHPRATIILPYRPEENLRQLAEAIHTLRLSMGRYASIVVQEKNASLRYQNEALLLRLGTNLVVHRDVPSARIPLLLESIKGQVFNRDVDINFEAAMVSVTPTRARGYLPPARFVREVSTILDCSATLSIPYVLIKAVPRPELSMVECLSLFGFSRPGDLLTSDDAHLYLFLNACQQAVLLPTLERLLGKSVDEIFADMEFFVRAEEVRAELAGLLRVAERSEVTDYTELLTTVEPTMPATAPVAQPATPQERIPEVPDYAARGGQALDPEAPAMQPSSAAIRALSKDMMGQIRAGAVTAAAPVSLSTPVKPGVPHAFGTKEAPRATRAVPKPATGTDGLR